MEAKLWEAYFGGVQAGGVQAGGRPATDDDALSCASVVSLPSVDNEQAEEEWDPEEALIKMYGEDWQEKHGIKITSDTYCPGLEAGWMICTLCNRQLAGLWSVFTHFESRNHRRNFEWQFAHSERTAEFRECLALPPSEGWRAPPIHSSWAPSIQSAWMPPIQSQLPPLANTSWSPPPPPPSGMVPPPPPPPPGDPEGWFLEGSPPQLGVTRSSAPPPPSDQPPFWGGPPPPPSAPPPPGAPPGDSMPPCGGAPTLGACGMASESSNKGAPTDGTYVVAKVYDGLEWNEAGEIEGGYIALAVGDRATLLSEASSGHAANKWQRYAYGELASGQEGWLPVDCLKLS